jgi:methylated-DNA-[protein]-cysteine S-methyltransferase
MKFKSTQIQTTYASPLGSITLAASSAGLTGVWFENQQHRPAQLSAPGSWCVDDAHPVLQMARSQLAAYFQGDSCGFDLPLDLSEGTAFQQSVWRALLAIPRGTTRSYGALSAHINRPSAVRAVGSAIGRNPLSIIVPCHRVVGSTGALTGYAGGLDRKAALLRLEGAL